MLNTQLRDHLVKLLEKDQTASQVSEEEYKKIYSDNEEELKTIIDEYGWPTLSLVGPEGTEAAWFIAQHADHDVDFQKKCLGLITEAVEKKEAPKHHIAYLQDRILMNENKPQKFGTQIRYDQKYERYEPYPPVQDTANPDQLRMEYQLPPLEQYIQILKNFKNKK